MSDFALDTTGDLVIRNDGYASAPSLESQVRLSILIHRGQWWADPDWGSEIYTLVGQPVTQDIMRQVERFAREALQFMVTQGKASQIRATATLAEGGKDICLDIEVVRGTDIVARARFDELWNEVIVYGQE